jgi:RNA polymerase sigma-70 factor (ECF subfamily)
MQNQREEQTLKNALQGDIYAFQELFALFQAQLKSYLYRLVASRNDAEDLAHDTFLRAYSKLHLFRGDSSLKTWVFQIATNLAYTHLQHRKRWTLDVLEQAKALVGNSPEMVEAITLVATTSTEATYDIQEHIDTCFTCMAKTLPIENQVALLLKDVYDFSVNEIGIILEKSEGVVKYLLQSARQTMTDIFEQRWFNPKQDQQEALMKLDLVKGSKKYNRDELYTMRTALVKSIDPRHGSGHELQEILLKCNRMAMGELVTLG